MKLKKDDIPFTMVANEVLKDSRLSFKAKGMYAYLFSKPDEWDFSSDRMTLETTDGRKSIMSMLRELEDAGYLQRQRLPNGKMEYTLKHSLSPETALRLKKPKFPLGTVPKRLRAKRALISNTEEGNNTEEKVIHNTGVPPEAKKTVFSVEGADIIKAFEEVDPKNKTYYGHKTQRSSADFLIKEYGLEKVIEVIHILPRSNSLEFCPRITSPYDLKEKWKKLEMALISIKNKQPVLL